MTCPEGQAQTQARFFPLFPYDAEKTDALKRELAALYSQNAKSRLHRQQGGYVPSFLQTCVYATFLLHSRRPYRILQSRDSCNRTLADLGDVKFQNFELRYAMAPKIVWIKDFSAFVLSDTQRNQHTASCFFLERSQGRRLLRKAIAGAHMTPRLIRFHHQLGNGGLPPEGKQGIAKS